MIVDIKETITILIPVLKIVAKRKTSPKTVLSTRICDDKPKYSLTLNRDVHGRACDVSSSYLTSSVDLFVVSDGISTA